MNKNIREQTFSSVEVTQLSWVTYRQLDYWVRQGVVDSKGMEGSGNPRRFTFADVVLMALAKKLRDYGVSVEAIAGGRSTLLLGVWRALSGYSCLVTSDSDWNFEIVASVDGFDSGLVVNITALVDRINATIDELATPMVAS